MIWTLCDHPIGNTANKGVQTTPVGMETPGRYLANSTVSTAGKANISRMSTGSSQK